MSLGIKCFNCSGDTITRIMQTLACSGRHTGEQHGVCLGAMTLHLQLVRSVLCSALNLIIYLSTPYSFIHVNTFSRPMKYSLLYHSCFDTSKSKCRQIPASLASKQTKQFQSIHLTFDAKNILFTCYISTHLIINTYHPCGRCLMHAYHLFLPLYK